MPGDEDARIRSQMFSHLDRLLAASPDGSLSSKAINTFTFDGRDLRLVVQSGIWKPAGLKAAISIRTALTPPDQPPHYEDDVGDDGLVHYKYRGTDPNHSDNRALRKAMVDGLPLAYFVGVARGVYVPRYPVWLIEEDRARLEFAIAVDEGQRFVDLTNLPPPQREYVERLTRSRLHQPVFRARVLRAYGDRCAMCRLHHGALLDAAHIVPDGEPRGEPIVPNGLALCKIHHAAYDFNLIGVRPDLVVDVAPRIRDEIDGPMLRHGLQEMAGAQLLVPHQRAAQPDPQRLAYRYERFREAS
jgi:putative restriction endonuclease